MVFAVCPAPAAMCRHALIIGVNDYSRSPLRGCVADAEAMAATLEAFGDAIADSCPLKRIGEPEDMAGVALYLSSRAGAYVTGVVIPVDGGIRI